VGYFGVRRSYFEVRNNFCDVRVGCFCLQNNPGDGKNNYFNR
jgi:hypothetical protein